MGFDISLSSLFLCPFKAMICVCVVLYMNRTWNATQKQGNLTESGKSPASIALSNKQWVGTCLYQEWYKPLLISCEAATRL